MYNWSYPLRMPNATPDNRRAQRNRNKARKRHWVGLYKLSHGCADCGWIPQDMDHSQLDLDHLPGQTKLDDVSTMVSEQAGWDKIRAEVAKCEVVCRPCHLERTEARQWRAAGLPVPKEEDLPCPY